LEAVLKFVKGLQRPR